MLDQQARGKLHAFNARNAGGMTDLPAPVRSCGLHKLIAQPLANWRMIGQLECGMQRTTQARFCSTATMFPGRNNVVFAYISVWLKCAQNTLRTV